MDEEKRWKHREKKNAWAEVREQEWLGGGRIEWEERWGGVGLDTGEVIGKQRCPTPAIFDFLLKKLRQN